MKLKDVARVELGSKDYDFIGRQSGKPATLVGIFLAFILGLLPLAISHGAGARQAVGTGVMGGMLAATFLAVFFVPLFYRLIADRKLSEARSTDAMFAEIKETHAKAHEKLLERAKKDEEAHGDNHA